MLIHVLCEGKFSALLQTNSGNLCPQRPYPCDISGLSDDVRCVLNALAPEADPAKAVVPLSSGTALSVKRRTTFQA